MFKRFFLILCILSTAFVSPTAQDRVQASGPAAPETRVYKGPLEEFWLPVQAPDFNQIYLPPNLSADQARHFADQWIAEQADQALAELAQRKAEGEIMTYDFVPERAAIRVSLKRGSAQPARLLGAIPQLIEAQPDNSTCGADYRRAIQEQFVSRSQPHTRLASTTDPSVLGLPGNFPSVNGVTQANIPVSLVIKRGGNPVATQETTSSADGSYYFSPPFMWCGSAWSLLPGDIIEVSAHGNTVSVTVVPLDAWLDPQTNQVVGTSAPGANLVIDVHKANLDDLCGAKTFSQTITAGGDGSFLADFTSQVDIQNMAYTYILAVDQNGNGVRITTEAFYISFYDSYFYGQLKPLTPYTATLIQSGSADKYLFGITTINGSYYGGFGANFIPGDVLQVSGGGTNLSTTVQPLSVSIDADLDQITGHTAPGLPVQVSLYGSSYGISCNVSTSVVSGCQASKADDSGNFVLNIPQGLERGDWVRVYIFDAAGNSKFMDRYAHVISSNPSGNRITGNWRTPGESIHVQIRNGANQVTQTFTVTTDTSLGYYGIYSANLTPGDSIAVGNGVITDTTTVPTLSAELNGATGHLVGEASASKYVVYFGANCREGVHAGGAFDLDFSSLKTTGQNAGALLRLVGSDGNLFEVYSHAFYALLSYTGNFFLPNFMIIYVPTPNVPVQVQFLSSQGFVYQTYDLTADTRGYINYYGVFSANPGEHFKVTSGAYQIDLPIPELTISIDPAQSRVLGSGPPSSAVEVTLSKYIPTTKSYATSLTTTRNTQTDQGGNYSVSFAGTTFCGSAVDLSAACIGASIKYTRPDGFEFASNIDTPLPTQDAFEPDNFSSAALTYNGPGQHNFHAGYDIDWIKFSVNPEDVGRPLVLQTNNLGPFGDTVMELYSTDATTLLASNDDGNGSYGSRLVWNPPAAGTYFVKIAPYSTQTRCGTSYTFMLTNQAVFLPLLRR